ncbi:MAG: hypothetical protein ABR910_08540 [Acidobacteriaceae bacterium]|jgi:hypothetical protein
MGGERASTARMRLEGKICCFCKSSLPPPHLPGERVCDRCKEERSPRRRIYMHFMLNRRWYCQFLEEDLKTPLPRKITFSDEAKLFEMAERGGYRLNLEGRQAIEHAIRNGRGGIWLQLSEDQYSKLKCQ